MHVSQVDTELFTVRNLVFSLFDPAPSHILLIRLGTKIHFMFNFKIATLFSLLTVIFRKLNYTKHQPLCRIPDSWKLLNKCWLNTWFPKHSTWLLPLNAPLLMGLINTCRENEQPELNHLSRFGSHTIMKKYRVSIE